VSSSKSDFSMSAISVYSRDRSIFAHGHGGIDSNRFSQKLNISECPLFLMSDFRIIIYTCLCPCP
jgi:hypothetical protein